MAGSQFNEGWWTVLSNSVRTGVTATASFLIARLFRLPEAYWAPITTLVITQSSLGTALAVSWQRLVGTILGALVGALVAAHFGPHALVFGACVLILGFLCALTTFGSERLSLCGRYARDHPLNTQDKPSMVNRTTPVHRSIYWYRRSSAPNYIVA